MGVTKYAYGGICECGDHAWGVARNLFVVLVSGDAAALLHIPWAVKTGRKPYLVNGSGDARSVLHRRLLGAPAHLVVDHINGNVLDNRLENLRLCTTEENSQNKHHVAGHTSRFKGVSRRQGFWKAAIKHRKQTITIGCCFRAEEDAARAYDLKATEIFGRFARTNESLGLLS